MIDDHEKGRLAERFDGEEELPTNLAADLSKIGEWFVKTVELEQERSEARSRDFEVGEGIEMVLDD